MGRTLYRPPDGQKETPQPGCNRAEAEKQKNSTETLARDALIFDAEIALELCRLDVLRRFLSETRGAS